MPDHYEQLADLHLSKRAETVAVVRDRGVQFILGMVVSFLIFTTSDLQFSSDETASALDTTSRVLIKRWRMNNR